MSNLNNVLLIGGGITSSLISFFLRNQRVHLDLWEKSNNLGGRMTTWCSKHTQVPVDIGAQYFTVNQQLVQSHKDVYDYLLNQRLIEPLNCIIENIKSEYISNFIAPKGMDSVVSHFLFSNSHIRNVICSRTVNGIDIRNNSINVITESGDETLYDGVVITLPVPVILKLNGNFREVIDIQTLEKLQKVVYTSRFVLVLVYNKIIDIPWAARYTPTDEIFRYVAIHEKKVGIESESKHSSVVFHTSVQFGEQYDCPVEAYPVLMNHARELYSFIEDPVDSYCRKWEQSQVILPYPNTKGCVIISHEPLIIFTGDGFSSSNFDGCITSAECTAQTIMGIIKNQ